MNSYTHTYTGKKGSAKSGHRNDEKTNPENNTNLSRKKNNNKNDGWLKNS